MDELHGGQESGRWEYHMGFLPAADGVRSNGRYSRGKSWVLTFPIPELESLLEDNW